MEHGIGPLAVAPLTPYLSRHWPGYTHFGWTILCLGCNGGWIARSVYSFGDGFDLCLGNGDTRDEQLPHAIQAFKTKGVHILRVCAGDEHAVAIDSNGYVNLEPWNVLVPSLNLKSLWFHNNFSFLFLMCKVYTWGRCDIGAPGHGDENDKPTPEVLLSLKKHIAVQV